MRTLRGIQRMLDLGLEALLTVAMAALVLDVVWQVVTRFVLRHPSSWTEELATFLLIWVGLLGACVALNRSAHLGIDYFVMKMPPACRHWAEVFAFVCVALFSAAVLGYGGSTLVVRTLALGQTSPALGIRMGYVYVALPVSGFFLAVYSIAGLVRALRLSAGGTARSTGEHR